MASTDRRFSTGVTRQAQVRPYRRRPGDPVRRPLRIFTIDSGTARTDAPTATVEVPWEPLAPGPAGALLLVDTTDGDNENSGADLDDPRVLIRGGLDPSVSDHQFHQQMVYAVCSQTYSQFQSALGRLVPWGFDAAGQGGRLRLRPHAPECGANAVYDRDRGQISFGYFPAPSGGAGRIAPQGVVFTCLSHDVIVHEFTHALLDGLRSHFIVPTGGDVLGFHEGFADLVAIFQHFAYREVVEEQIRRFDGVLEQSTLLADIADQFGVATQGRALRCAIRNANQRYSPDMEPHEMGAVLLSAVFAAFMQVYKRKAQPFTRLAFRPPSGQMLEELVSFLASKAQDLAKQFLAMCIRALDYCPPIDLHLGEYLRAIVTADRELVADDRWGYRDALITAFAERGIYPPGVGQLTEDSLAWRPPARLIEPLIPLHFANLRFAGDPSLPAGEAESIRQAEALWDFVTRPHVTDEFGLGRAGIDGVEPAVIESIRTSRRAGPDGEVLFDLVAEITQCKQVIDPATGAATRFFGGCTVILGPEGDTRYIISKNVGNRERLDRQLSYQRSSGYWTADDGQYRMRGYAHQLVHGARRPAASPPPA